MTMTPAERGSRGGLIAIATHGQELAQRRGQAAQQTIARRIADAWSIPWPLQPADAGRYAAAKKLWYQDVRAGRRPADTATKKRGNHDTNKNAGRSH